MAWKEVSVMSQRAEFVVLASTEGANVSELCRRFGVSRKTGYKWLARSVSAGLAGLADRDTVPQHPECSLMTLQPDVLVKLSPDDWLADRDPQLDRAIEMLLHNGKAQEPVSKSP